MSKNYQILALKWRPKHFKDVVGQDHITETLQKAFEKNRIAQAFLFAGPRGVGKTTTARLLAMSLNGSDTPSIDYDADSDAVKEIIEGRSMDVIEIDGASNRGIDEIRELRENIKFMPLSGKFKVVIIDEVHMLTVQAFNALLKTLEEPPAHVKFIMATTDIHKVPQTIISRCQRFDFLPMTNAVIKDRLNHILKIESVKIDDTSLELIATKSDGSMRDALGFLDQVLVFSDKEITSQIVTDLLGIVPSEIYFDITNALHDKDGDSLVSVIQKIRDKGYIIEDLLKGLIGHFRNLSLLHYTKGLGLAGISPELAKVYKSTSYKWTLKDLVRLSTNLSELYSSIKQFSDQYLIFEMTLIKLLQFDKSIDIESFLQSDVIDNTITEKPVKQSTPKVISTPKIKSVPKVETVKPLEKEEKKADNKSSAVSLEDIKDSWEKIIKKISKERGSIGVLLEACIVGDLKDGTLEVISYDSNDFSQKLLQDPFVASTINSILGSTFEVKIVVDTNVEKIEKVKEEINQDDIVKLFDGKDFA
ncbi:MAG: DNA polymerase III subunit gamma/tau [Candidatus Marinimicrobia bacterium]|nr:DNA polymerase III subunit gamma/tau [Candidatus Neomarinimicrobiota bacterium]